MSARKSGLASTRIDLRSGCAWLATVAEPSRLSVKLCRAASAMGVPSFAV